LAKLVFDPFVAQEQGESQGDLLAHFQTPLLVGDDVYMLVKSGSYVSCVPPGSGHLANDAGSCGPDTWDQQVWTEKHLRWENGALVEKWTFASDWKPEPTTLTFEWEAVFQPVVVGAFLYVPGAGGALWKIDRASGATLAHIQPFGSTIDPSTYVAGPLTADASGNVYYNALKIDPTNVANDATGWLVKVSQADAFITATYASLVPDAPKPAALCDSVFSPDQGYSAPNPPPPNEAGVPASPPKVPCLSQRPGINVAPAIGADGTVFTLSRAHGEDRYSYVVAVNPDLTPKWDASLRGRIADGCGVTLPATAMPTLDGGVNGKGCRVGAEAGVDPDTNDVPGLRVLDVSSSTPVVLPDGSVLYGAFSSYNTARGHLIHFDATGKFLATYDFGWDVTPAVRAHDGTYSVIVKDNHYFNWSGPSAGPYAVTQLGAAMNVEWGYNNANTMSCSRDAGGVVTCVNDHPQSFEWCVNAPAIDGRGMTYANSEDGNLYVLDRDGGLASSSFLELALGAAYTPVAIDYQGRIYALNGGTMRVLGR
jgi:hypothetical protein